MLMVYKGRQRKVTKRSVPIAIVVAMLTIMTSCTLQSTETKKKSIHGFSSDNNSFSCGIDSLERAFVMSSNKSPRCEQMKITMHEFSCDDIPVSCGIDSLVRAFGIPNSSHIQHDRVRIAYNSTGEIIGRHYFDLYAYPDRRLVYTVCGDSAQLYNVDLRYSDIRIRFRNSFLDGNTTINQLNKLLHTTNSCYTLMEDSALFWGYSDYGYLLMYFGDEYSGLGSVNFYFDKDQKLIYIDFCEPPGSIVYHSK